VTLHNIDEIERLGVQIGDEVEVIRAGDVIPKIIRVVSKGKKRTKITIDACPACGSPLVRKRDHFPDLRLVPASGSTPPNLVRVGPKLYCTNANNCEGTQFKKIKKWVKKRNIMFLGESNLKSLWDDGCVRKIVDLYLLSITRMVDAGLGERMAEKILAEIEKSKKCSLSDFMGSLSLDMLGRSEAANLVAQGVDTLGEWEFLSAAKIAAMPGYQKTKATRISKAVADNWGMIIDLASELQISSKPKGDKLANKSFCFTGTMKNSRKDLEEKAVDAGGQIRSVSKGLTYLVIADPASTSSKAVKARDLGTKLISEQSFLEMAEN
jgi:DNA ligase (NAD+)